MLTIATTPDWLFFTVAILGILVVLVLIVIVCFAIYHAEVRHQHYIQAGKHFNDQVIAFDKNESERAKAMRETVAGLARNVDTLDGTLRQWRDESFSPSRESRRS